MINGSPTNLDTPQAAYAYDSESGLYYCSARYYDPASRQWTTTDAAKADDEASAYQYCGGDPIGKVDPSGAYAHAFVLTAYVDQTAYFLKVMEVDAGRVKERLQQTSWRVWKFAYWFYESVRTHGAWDLKWCMGRSTRAQEDKVFKFKGHWISLDDFGNIHFGYVAAATGLGPNATVGGAAAVSVLHHKPWAKTFTDETFVAWGWNLFSQYGFCRRPDSELNRFICPGSSTVLGYAMRYGGR